MQNMRVIRRFGIEVHTSCMVHFAAWTQADAVGESENATDAVGESENATDAVGESEIATDAV